MNHDFSSFFFTERRKNHNQTSEPIDQQIATNADKFSLYEEAINMNPLADINFLCKVFQEKYRRNPTILREDFCGTAKLCTEFVSCDVSRQGIGVDLDPLALAWATENNLARLGPSSDRLMLIQSDVTDEELLQRVEKADVIVAFNYSMCFFHTRRQLVYKEISSFFYLLVLLVFIWLFFILFYYFFKKIVH